MKSGSKFLHENIRQVSFVILLFGMLCLMVFELRYFVSAGLGGFTLYMLLRKPHRWLMGHGWRKIPATITLLVATIILLFGVGGAIITPLLPKIAAFKPQMIADNINSIHDYILDKTGYNIFSKDMADKAIASLGQFLPSLFTATGSIFVNGFMALVIAFFMLQAGAAMEAGFSSKLPLSPESISLMRHETSNIVVSNAIGIPIIMAGHALVSGLGYWALDAGDPIAWGILTGICGLVPVVGTAAIWVPLAINMFVAGNIWQSMVLILFGALIIANVDNVLRMMILKRSADVHPLVTLFGIILGINLFGFWGIIFGPLMISGFLLMTKIYHNEFLDDKPKITPLKNE